MAFVPGQGVIEAGENLVKVYAKKVATEDEVVAFAETELIGELKDITGLGAKRDTKEMDGYHYPQKIKEIKNSVSNDVSLKENLTKAQVDVVEGFYDNKDFIAVGIFTGEDNQLLYGFVGQISEWGETIPLGDTCELDYTMTVRAKRKDLTVAPAA